jgi:menaquinol-cytochrome c reductase iron-sulfur subunit
MADDPDRRKFLTLATCALGGGFGLVVVAPSLRLLADPAGKKTVTSPSEPLDIGNAQQFVAGAPPMRVEVIAPLVKDGWTSAHNVVIGAAWVRRTGPRPEELDVRSAVCPHLGCPIGYDGGQNNYLCACHNSRFELSGAMKSGPSKRGMDQLPIAVKDGRLMLTWERYKLDTGGKEKV